MADAGSLLGQLLGAALSNGSVRGGGQTSAPGGLGDILGQVLGGAAGGGGASRSGGQGDAMGGLPGGLGDILGQVLGGAAGGAASRSGGQGNAMGGLPGGLGDILGQVLGGGRPSGGPSGGASGMPGGLGDILGQVLGGGAATGGGISGGTTGGLGDIAADALGGGASAPAGGATQAPTQTPTQFPTQFPTHVPQPAPEPAPQGGRQPSGGGDLVKYGGLAIIGMLAFNAFRKWQAQAGQGGRAGFAPDMAAEGGFAAQQAPGGAEAFSKTLLLAMAAAAQADGQIDGDELARITGGLERMGAAASDRDALVAFLTTPVDPQAVVNAATSPEAALQIYAASAMAIRPDSAVEKQYLASLAQALDIDPGLKAQVDADLNA